MLNRFIIFFLIFFPLYSFGQCNGVQSFTLFPATPTGGYTPGTVVTVCYTMNGYPQTGANWIEGFDLTLGPGWTNLTPLSPPANCPTSTGGQWLWLNSSTNSQPPIVTVGPGYFFDLDMDGIAGDDYGDQGSCSWTFCFKVTVSNSCTPQNLLIQVTPGSDGTWGSFISTACDVVTPFTVYSGLSNPTLPSIGLINHN